MLCPRLMGTRAMKKLFRRKRYTGFSSAYSSPPIQNSPAGTSTHSGSP